MYYSLALYVKQLLNIIAFKNTMPEDDPQRQHFLKWANRAALTLGLLTVSTLSSAAPSEALGDRVTTSAKFLVGLSENLHQFLSKDLLFL